MLPSHPDFAPPMHLVKAAWQEAEGFEDPKQTTTEDASTTSHWGADATTNPSATGLDAAVFASGRVRQPPSLTREALGSPDAASALTMSLLLFLVFGIVAGLIARAIMPGKQGMGIIMTGVLGIAGSLVGGFVGSLVTGDSVLDFHTSGIIGSVLGALAVLFIMGFAGRSRATA